MPITYQEVLDMKKNQKINLPLMKKDLKALPSVIGADENLLTFILSNTKPQALLCLTDKRVLYISAELSIKSLAFGKNTGLKEISIPLEKVNSIGRQQEVVYGSISLTDGATDYLFEKLTKTEIDRFVSLLKEYTAKAPIQNENFSVPNSKTPAEQIREFKELLDDGVISQEEFDKKKNDLLK